MTKPDQHIYNYATSNDSIFRRKIDHALDRGQSIRLHHHAAGEQCGGKCVTYEPAEEGGQ